MLVQYPDTNGEVKDLSLIAQLCKESGCIMVSATDLLALTLIKSPGDYGEGIAVTSGVLFANCDEHRLRHRDRHRTALGGRVAARLGAECSKVTDGRLVF